MVQDCTRWQMDPARQIYCWAEFVILSPRLAADIRALIGALIGVLAAGGAAPKSAPESPPTNTAGACI